MLAAVMPLPSEEVTPPVTKTYFAMGLVPPGVFPILSKRGPGCESKHQMERWPERRLTPVAIAPALALVTRTGRTR